MNDTFSMFDVGKPRFKIDKKIRLIELFAGYGSQALALKYLGVPFEHWLISEWAVPSILAYAKMHTGEDGTKDAVVDYSAGYSDEWIRFYFHGGRISSNYSDPIPDKTIDRMPIGKLREIYNAMKVTNNVGSICGLHGEELRIEDTDKYTYVMTYSFPCQDLSQAGQQKGAVKGSGTRSAILWEIERLFRQTAQYPQVLLMENVPALLEQNNRDVFNEWYAFLDSLGYSTKYAVLNASDYMIPQNRNRVFCVSVLGDWTFDMPSKMEGCPPLSELLEKDVDEKLYLSDEQTKVVINSQFRNVERERERARTIRNGGAGSLDDKHTWDIVLVSGECRGERREQDFESAVREHIDGESDPARLVRRNGRDSGGVIPLNALTDGTSRTLTAHYAKNVHLNADAVVKDGGVLDICSICPPLSTPAHSKNEPERLKLTTHRE